MGVVAITFIMKLQGTILILAVLICQLQCAPKGCRGCEWDNTGQSNGHTTGQATGKRAGVINVFKKSDDGNPDDNDALLPQNWWESKQPMGDGAASVKRDGADPRGCRGCGWEDTENQPSNDQEKTKRDNNPADTDAIVPTGPTNGQEGDGVVNVKRSDNGNPDDTDALLPQNWWESKQPMGDGAVNVKRSDDQDGSPEDTDALLPQNWWESKEPMGDGAASVKRDGADPRGCRGCEWDDTENQPSNDQEKTKRDNNPADTDAIVPTGPTNGQEGDGAINVKRGWDDSENPSGPDGPPPIDGANEPRFYPCKGPYCVGDQGWGKRSANNNPADTDAIIPTGPTNGKEGDGVINVKRS